MDGPLLPTHTYFVNKTQHSIGYLISAGTYNCPRSLKDHAMSVKGHYGIAYLVSGSGFYKDGNGVRSRLKPGHLVLSFPALPRIYGPSSASTDGWLWNELFFNFEGPAFDVWRDGGLFNPEQPIHFAEPVEYWLKRLRAVAEEPLPGTTGENASQVSRFLEILAGMLNLPSQFQERPKDWVEKAKLLLARDLGAEANQEFVAQRCHMTYGSFRQAFRRETGVSPMQYRLLKRLEVAQSMLRQKDLTQAAIARSLGFLR